MATERPDIIPPFAHPAPVQSISVDQVLHDRFVISSGIQFHKYKTLLCIDQKEIAKSSSAYFLW